MRVIDGSFGEGGGQILRTALALATIKNEDVKIINIRAKRENPGLRPQHLLAAKAIAEICNGRLEGASIGSRELIFHPSKIKGGRYNFDVGTAGSVTLVLQALLPVVAFANEPIKITLKGGTAVPKSPTVSYFERIFLVHLQKIGFKAKIRVLRHGFYPKGGGIVEVETEPSQLKPLNLERFGSIKEIFIQAYSEGLPCHVVEREVTRSLEILESYNVSKELAKIEKLCFSPTSSNVGNFFFISASGSEDTVVGYDAIGMKGLPAEKVAQNPSVNLVENVFKTNAALDLFAGDQLLIWLALAKGSSSITTHKYTLHAYTTLHLLRDMLGIDFKVEGSLDSFARLTIRGNKL